MGVTRTIRGKREDEGLAESEAGLLEDSESEDVTSVSESVESDHVQLFQFQNYSNSALKTRTISPAPRLSSSLGQRRARRLANTKFLIDLAGNEVETDTLEPSRSMFSIVLDGDLQGSVLQDFLNGTEQPYTNNSFKDNQVIKYPFTADYAFKSLTSTQRGVLKRNRSLGFVFHIHNELLSFFIESPSKTYAALGLNSFERLILHAVAGYYQLHSQSYDTEENGRMTIVSNPHASFQVPDILLVDHLNRINASGLRNNENFSFPPINLEGNEALKEV